LQNNVNTAPAKYDTLVWIYEWPNTDSASSTTVQRPCDKEILRAIEKLN